MLLKQKEVIILIDRRDNPEFLNEFLDYSASIQNRSKNSIKEYNYDLVHFFKFINIVL